MLKIQFKCTHGYAYLYFAVFYPNSNLLFTVYKLIIRQ